MKSLLPGGVGYTAQGIVRDEVTHEGLETGHGVDRSGKFRFSTLGHAFRYKVRHK